MKKLKLMDLHIHSISSHDFSKKERAELVTHENYIDALFKKLGQNEDRETPISVFSITDHNVVDPKLVELILNKIEKEKINFNFYPGIEMNIKWSNERNGTNLHYQHTEDDYFHSLLIFDPETDIIKLNKKLNKIYDDSGLDNFKDLSTKRKKSSAELGFVLNELSEFDFYFIPHYSKGNRSINKYFDITDEKTLTFVQNLIFYNNSKISFDGKSEGIKKVMHYYDKKDSWISGFSFSDTHSVNDVMKDRKNIGDKGSCTWVNFSGDFDDLVLLLTEKESRTKEFNPSEQYPQKNINSYLSAIKITFEDGSDEDILFSPGLNGVIGPRGSGKTSLLSFIKNHDKDLLKVFLIKEIKYEYGDSGEWVYDKPKATYIEQSTLSKIFKKNGQINKVKEIEEKIDRIKNRIQFVTTNKNNEILISSKKARQLFNDFHLKHNLTTFNFYSEKPASAKPKNIPDEILGIPLKMLTKIDQVVEGSQLIDNKLKEAYDLSISINKGNFIWEKDFKKMSELLSSLIKEKEGYFDFQNIDDKKSDIKIKSILLNAHYFASGQVIKQSSNDFAFYNSVNYISAASKLRYYLLEIFSDIDNKIKEVYSFYKKISDEEEFDLKITKNITIKILNEFQNNLDIIMIINDHFKNKTQFEEIDEFIHYFIFMDDYNYLESLNKKKCLNVYSKVEFLEFLSNTIFNEISKLTDVSFNLEKKDGDSTKPISPGTIAGAIWELILEERFDTTQNELMIFDQPEQDLDMIAINKIIIQSIKKMKWKKQFIIVSHSAPIIINGDADQIIICNDKNGKLEFNSKEYRTMDEDVIRILDGGKRLMTQRYNKYSMKWGKND